MSEDHSSVRDQVKPPFSRQFSRGYALVKQGPDSVTVEWGGICTRFSAQEKDQRMPQLVDFLMSLIDNPALENQRPEVAGIQWAVNRLRAQEGDQPSLAAISTDFESYLRSLKESQNSRMAQLVDFVHGIRGQEPVSEAQLEIPGIEWALYRLSVLAITKPSLLAVIRDFEAHLSAYKPS